MYLHTKILSPRATTQENKKHVGQGFFSPKRQSLSSWSGAGNFYLAHGLRQLTYDIRPDVRTLNFRSDVIFAQPQITRNNVQKRLLCDLKFHP